MTCNSGRLRGKHAEVRLKTILRTLVGNLQIKVISQAPQKLDGKGVDIIVQLLCCGKKIFVPIQVKSSNLKAKDWRRKYPTYISDYNVILVIVNNSKTDEQLRDEVLEALQTVIESNISYESFYEMLNISSQEKRSHIDALEELLENEIRLLNSRKKMRYVPAHLPQRSAC